MSLDKFFGGKKTPPASAPPPVPIVTPKKKTTQRPPQQPQPPEVVAPPTTGGTPKWFLKCTKATCKRTRIIRKKTLGAEDYVCPGCNGTMTEYTPRTSSKSKTNEDGDGDDGAEQQ